MQNEYVYKNKVSFCPECGASLKENSLYCPACGVNLAGLNERHNRLTNFQKSEADIRKVKEKQENIEKILEKESKKASRGAIYIILGAIAALSLLVYAPAFIEEAAVSNNNETNLEAYGYKAMEGLSAEDYLLNNPEQMAIKITETPAEFVQHNQESEKTKDHSIDVLFSFNAQTQQTKTEYLLAFDENNSFKVAHITSFEEMFLPEYEGLSRSPSYYDGMVSTWRIEAPITNGSIYSGYSGEFYYSIIKGEDDAGFEGALSTLVNTYEYYTENDYIKHLKNITVQYADETEREFVCFATDDYNGLGVQIRLMTSLGDGYYFMVQLPSFRVEGEDEFMNIIDRYLNIKIERVVQN